MKENRNIVHQDINNLIKEDCSENNLMLSIKVITEINDKMLLVENFSFSMQKI